MERPTLTRRGFLTVSAIAALAGCKGTGGDSTEAKTETLEIPRNQTQTVTMTATPTTITTPTTTERPDDGDGGGGSGGGETATATTTTTSTPTPSEVVIEGGDTRTADSTGAYSAIVWEPRGQLVIESAAGFILTEQSQ